MIVFIRGETLSAHSVHPRKIPVWLVLASENISVNKRANRKKNEIVIREILCVFFLIIQHLAFHGFHLKKLKIIQHDF